MLMICLNLVIALFTISGVSALVTNGRLKSGGPYYLISRTLGAELGGAIGVLLLIEHVVATVYYLATFGEVIQLSSNTLTGSVDYKFSFSKTSSTSSICLLLCLIFALLGPRGYSTVALAFFWVKVVALFVALASFFQLSSTPIPTNSTNATIHNYFTGPSSRSFSSNLYQHERTGEEILNGTPFNDFLVLYSIIFAAFAGLLCGVNLTGEVRNAGRSIPRGLMQATLFGVCFFSLAACIVSVSVWRLWNLPDGARDVMLRVCVDEWIVLIGMMACCIGTASVHMLSASNTLTAMARDRLIPFFTPQRFSWIARPTSFLTRNWGIIITWLIMQCSVFAGSPTRVASMLSLTYLFFTAIVNAAVLLLLFLQVPNFRPMFKLFNKWTCAMGCVAPIVLMFGIDRLLTLIFIGGFLMLVVVFAIAAPSTEFGEVTQVVLFHHVRKYLLRLGSRGTHLQSARFWQPAPLLFQLHSPVFCEAKDEALAKVASALKKGGLFVLSSVVTGKYDADSLANREVHFQHWNSFIARNNIKALPVVDIDESLGNGLRHVLLLTGIGPVRPNMVMLPWPTSSSIITPFDWVALQADVLKSKHALVVCKGVTPITAQLLETGSTLHFASSTSCCWPHPQKRFVDDAGTKRRVDSGSMCIDVFVAAAALHSNFTRGDPSSTNDEVQVDEGSDEPEVYWDHYEDSVRMCLQLANAIYMSSKSPLPRKRIRVIVFVDCDDFVDVEKKRWKRYLNSVRIRSADVFVVAANWYFPSASNGGIAEQEMLVQNNLSGLKQRSGDGGDLLKNNDHKLFSPPSPLPRPNLVTSIATSSVSALSAAANELASSQKRAIDHGRVVDPLLYPIVTNSSSFIRSTSWEDRLGVFGTILKEECKESTLTLIPLCPPPQRDDKYIEYFSKLQEISLCVGASFFVSAKSNVISMDL
eukprot:m.98637 g.98637  ORF g.98637 m.98637 type:complete len:927 (-) comp9018_c0_seq1:894-3674(-)